MYSRYYLLFPVMLALGVILGITLPSQVIDAVFEPASLTIIRVIFYITIPYFFFSLIITTYELLSLGQWKDTLKTFFAGAFFVHAGIVLIGMIIFTLLPAQNLIPLARNADIIDPLTFERITSALFPAHWLQVLALGSLTPLLMLSTLLGAGAYNTLAHNHVLLEVFDGMRAIIMKILSVMLPWFIGAVVVLAANRIGGALHATEVFRSLSTLAITLSLIVLALMFVVFPLLLRGLGVPVHFSSWLRKLIPAAVVAFSGGSVIAAGGVLLHAEIPKNPRRKMIDTVVSFSFVFARAGVALVIALSYILIYKAFSAAPMNIFQFLSVFVLSILISLASETFSGSIISVGVASLSAIQFISVQDLYLIVVSFVPLLAGFAAAIDALCFGFLQMYVKHAVAQKHPLPFTDPDDTDI